MVRCLILGGTGFIGLHLAELLLREGYRVRIFDRREPAPVVGLAGTGQMEVQTGDFLDKQAVRSAVSGCDVVFHLVSTTLPKSSNTDVSFDVESNIVGTLQLLDVARESGIRKIIFSSSGGTIYGVPQRLPIPETHESFPLVAYGISKLAIEKYLHLYKMLYGIPYVVLRIGNVFGERQRTDTSQGAIAVFLSRALAGGTVEIWGDGTTVRDYIYIQDVVQAFMLAMSFEGAPSVFNIGSGEGLSLNDVLVAIEELLGTPVARRYVARRSFDVPANVLDISRAKELLGWTPRFAFREGLARTLEWMRQDREAKDADTKTGEQRG